MTQSKQTDTAKVKHIGTPAKPVLERSNEPIVTINEAHYLASSAPPPVIRPRHILALQRAVGNHSAQKMVHRYHALTAQTGPDAAADMIQRHPDDAASQWRTSALQQHETKLNQHDESLSQNTQAIEANKQDIALNYSVDKADSDTLFNWVAEVEGRVQMSETNIQQLAAKTQALESQSTAGGAAEVPASGGF